SALAWGPAIARASVSTSSDKVGSEQTGKLNPWRRAFRQARARPCAVFGPVLARAFARLALILRSLVKLHLLSWLASSRSLLTRGPRSLARAVATFRRGPPDADRSRADWRRGGAQRPWSGGRFARYSRGVLYIQRLV